MINLTIEEIQEITGATWHSRQLVILSDLGIPCKLRADGKPIVSRLAYEQAMGAKPSAQQSEQEPNWSAIA